MLHNSYQIKINVLQPLFMDSDDVPLEIDFLNQPVVAWAHSYNVLIFHDISSRFVLNHSIHSMQSILRDGRHLPFYPPEHIRSNANTKFNAVPSFAAELAMELRLSKGLILPLLTTSVTTHPSVEDWMSHWEHKLRQMFVAANPCIICMEPLLDHVRCNPCPGCNQTQLHLSCRKRCGNRCPLCRHGRLFLAYNVD